MAKKILAALLIAAMVLSLTSCGGGSKGKLVGIAQYAPHPALDASAQGFKDALKDAGFVEGTNITYEEQNAQGDQANCVTIANTMQSKNPDLVLTIATPIAQAVAKVITDKPVLITAVTDPVDAKLVASIEQPGGNVTGTSDLTPVAAQVALIKEAIPGIKTVGVMYCSSEPNSKIQADMAIEACESTGLAYQEFTVSAANEINLVAQSMIGKVEAVYIPTDNLLAENMKVVSGVTNPEGLPIIVGESGMVANGGIFTLGIDYYKLGYQTGEMAAKILKGEADPATMPIEYQSQYDISYNSKVAAEVGITLPDSILAGTDLAE
ncbi:MAG: ABC transporter substrate-binding protein [Oscillospiraceae bacterium]|nr:ABC transporter substrate-binding protein [Oscillospiraceae bacterium]